MEKGDDPRKNPGQPGRRFLMVLSILFRGSQPFPFVLVFVVAIIIDSEYCLSIQRFPR